MIVATHVLSSTSATDPGTTCRIDVGVLGGQLMALRAMSTTRVRIRNIIEKLLSYNTPTLTEPRQHLGKQWLKINPPRTTPVIRELLGTARDGLLRASIRTIDLANTKSSTDTISNITISRDKRKCSSAPATTI
jgi:hypothetical protein